MRPFRRMAPLRGAKSADLRDIADGPADAFSIALPNGDWVALPNGDQALYGPVFPVPNAATFSAISEGAPVGTVIGQMTWSGDDPTEWIISGSGVEVTPSGQVRTTGTLSPGLKAYTVQAKVGTVYTSAGVTISFTVNAAASFSFSSEPGTQVVIGSYPTHSNGLAVAENTLLWGSNGKLYYVPPGGGGNLGATSPTHTSGSAANGTATLVFGCTPDFQSTDYTAIQTAKTSYGSSLSTPKTIVVWGLGEVTGPTGVFILDINGTSTSPTNNLTVKVKRELSFKGAAAKALRYDPTKGLALLTDAYAMIAVQGGCNDFLFSGFMMKGTAGSNGPWAYMRSTLTDGTQKVEDCIVEGPYMVDAWSATFNNVLHVYDAAYTGAAVISGAYNLRLNNYTLIRSPAYGVGGTPVGSVGGDVYMTNCITSGFDNPPAGSVIYDHNAATNSAVHSGGTGNVTSTNAALFVAPSSTLSDADWRLKSGSPAIGAGAAAPTASKSSDIFDTTRGSFWDMGAHEFV